MAYKDKNMVREKSRLTGRREAGDLSEKPSLLLTGLVTIIGLE